MLYIQFLKIVRYLYEMMLLQKRSSMCLIVVTQNVNDDVMKWSHFLHYWPFVREIHRSPVYFPQRPVTRRFDAFFDVRLNKRVSKHSRCRWFETPWHSLWRHCNVSNRSPVLVWIILWILQIIIRQKFDTYASACFLSPLPCTFLSYTIDWLLNVTC